MSSTSRDTPLSLLERIQAGDQEAWTEFARKYVGVLEKWCAKWKIQNSDSQDVVQDTLLAVVVGVSNFQRRGKGSFRAWMKTIAWRCWCDALAKAERRQDQQVLKLLHDTRLPYEELEGAFEKLAVHELLQTSLERIRRRVEPKSWDAFHMTAFESRPAAEVAQTLDMNVDAVYATRCRIQRMITQEYKRLDDE